MSLGLAVKRLNPANVRAQCGLTMQQLAEKANLNRATIHKAEHQIPINRMSAYRILDVLNPIRIQRGDRPLDIGDLTWVIRGDGTAKKT